MDIQVDGHIQTGRHSLIQADGQTFRWMDIFMQSDKYLDR